MTKTKINQRTITQVKNIFKFNEKNYNDLAKLNAQIEKLEENKKKLEEAIDLAEQPVINMFGYKSSDLIEVVTTPLFNLDGTPKMTADGKYQQKKKTYVCKHGDNFLPTENEATIENETVNDESSDYSFSTINGSN